MKALIILFIIISLVSCRYNPSEKSITKVINIENSGLDSISGKYRYLLHTSHSDSKATFLYSNEKYELNDTLITINKKEYDKLNEQSKQDIK